MTTPAEHAEHTHCAAQLPITATAMPMTATLQACRFAEFFAGMGLVCAGLERAGWRCAFANDLSATKRALYLERYPDAARVFVLGDVLTLPAASVPTVTLATGSFPCQDLSLSTTKRSDQDE